MEILMPICPFQELLHYELQDNITTLKKTH